MFNTDHSAVVDLNAKNTFQEPFYVTLLEKTSNGPVSLDLSIIEMPIIKFIHINNIIYIKEYVLITNLYIYIISMYIYICVYDILYVYNG